MLSFDSNVLTSPIAISIALCATVCVIIYRYVNSNTSYWKDRGVKTASVGMFSRIGKEAYRVDHELVLKGGKLFGATMLSKPVLYCSDPELLRDILSKDFHVFTNRMVLQTGNSLFDNSIAFVRDEQWKRIRSIMSPTFSTGKLRRMKPLIDDCVNTMINNFENAIESGNSDCDVKTIFGAFSMDVIISVAFGTKINSLNDEDNPIIKNAKTFVNRDLSYASIAKLFLSFSIPKLAKMLKWSLFDNDAAVFFKELTDKITDERKKNPANVKRYDFLQLMLEATQENGSDTSDNGTSKIESEDNLHDETKFVTHNKTLTPEEFSAQCAMFFFAGYDTTATTLSYSAYNLAVNPEAQEKLYDEAKKAIESNNAVDYDIVHSLKYLDGVIWETLRLFPPAITLSRDTSEDYTLRDTGITIPKGMTILVPVYTMHHDPEHFPDPESFKPERFFPENRNHHQYAFLPSGHGPRNCIAMRLALMEAKIALIHAVYRFKFSISTNSDMPPKCYTGMSMIVPRNVILKVEKR